MLVTWSSIERTLLRVTCCLATLLVSGLISEAPRAFGAEPIKVLVWDEQQPVEPKIYPNFPGNFIAEHLRQNSELQVASASMDDSEQGLSSAALQASDVLVYWGHVRHDEISPEKSQEIVDMIKDGRLAMITLHSAHWSVPFMVAMQEKAAQDALEQLPSEMRDQARVRFTGEIQWEKPEVDDRNAFQAKFVIDSSGRVDVVVPRPHCVFLRCCTPNQPSLMRVIHPDHPITDGLPESFEIPETEMYDERFGVPEPDELLLTETWQGGEYFRSGMLWNLGRGKVFYFRPGDQQYAVYKEPHVLEVIDNACQWLGQQIQENAR